MNDETTRFEFKIDKKEEVKQIMTEVLSSLEEKGYDPSSQIVGYFLSGDPTYITSHKGARGVIRRLERDEILEIIVSYYIENKIKE